MQRRPKQLLLSLTSLALVLGAASEVLADSRYIISFHRQAAHSILESNVAKNLSPAAMQNNAAQLLTEQLNEVISTNGVNAKANTAGALTAVRELDLNAEQTLLVVNGDDDQINSLTALLNSTDDKDSDKNSILQAIRYIEPDQLVTADTINSTPNDWLYYSLWALQPNTQIHAPEAWQLTTGSHDVVVAVIDTGIDHQHADLAANMWVNTNEIPGNNIDDDNNGVIDDIYGYDAANDDGNPVDDQGHGSHVAGTIGALGNNSTGVIGVAPTTRLMALKFLNASGSGYTSDAIACLAYAVEMKKRGVNIRVTNNSWGGGGYSQSLKDAIAAANSEGILFVAAAGNNGRNTDSSSYYPQGYDVANVISVAATDSSSNLASFSNYGTTTVDIAAPGVGIISTYKQNQYGTMSGTSMATPHIAGIAALMYAVNNNLAPAQVLSILKETGSSLNSLNGKVASGKLANARAAVEKALEMADAPATVAGHITVAGLPLAGVSLTLTANSETRYSSTDNNGAYSFADLVAGGSYTLVATKSGFSFSPATSAGSLMGDLTVDFAATAVVYTLSGQVVSAQNVPAAGVSVVVQVNGASTTVVTDAAGSYSLGNLALGASYSVIPGLAGYQFSPAVATGTVTANTAVNFQIALATYTVSGLVKFSSGKGVEGAVVQFGERLVATAADGSFSFTGLQHGTRGSLVVQKEGYTFAPAAVDLTLTEDRVVNFTVGSVRSYTFAGNIKSLVKGRGGKVTAGKSISGAVLLITAADGETRMVQTSRSGAFAARLLPRGQLSVTVVAKGFDTSTSTVSLVRNSTKNTILLTARAASNSAKKK